VKYCSQCGQPVVLVVPDGDNRERFVCTACAEIHYQNPKVIAGCIVEWQDRILLCKRAIEPRHGFWTLPAGFMEKDETTAEAAARETLEEADAHVEKLELHTELSLPHASQVYMMYRASLVEPRFGPTHESLAVALFDEANVPWDQIAFTTVMQTLRFYFDDRRSGRYDIHVGDIVHGEHGFEYHQQRPR
jgi:ADP-ribose pyrophosphatase YjhB (NUDIX family)